MISQITKKILKALKFMRNKVYRANNKCFSKNANSSSVLINLIAIKLIIQSNALLILVFRRLGTSVNKMWISNKPFRTRNN